jgi:hypothetical protein
MFLYHEHLCVGCIEGSLRIGPEMKPEITNKPGQVLAKDLTIILSQGCLILKVFYFA